MAARGESARGARVIKVLVADSSALFRSGMRRAIEAEADLEVVGEADDLQQAAEAATTCRPDVIVAGTMTPSDLPAWRALPAAWARNLGMDATVTAAAAEPSITDGMHSETHQRCALVAVVDTAEGGREVLDAVMDAFSAGVLGCLDRSAGPEDLVYAIRAASRGRLFASSRVVRVLIDGLVRLREVASGFEEAVVQAMMSPTGAMSACRVPGAPRHQLTARECEVLALVARGKSNREIASTLSISEKTVKNHVSSLLRKLGADRRTQAAIWAISQNFAGSQTREPTTKVLQKNGPSD